MYVDVRKLPDCPLPAHYRGIMQLDPAGCYRAFQSKDSRFDGRFFAGVVTTGVYCRPICPAPRPKPRNVRFFLCAAAAEDAGFRPCRRCRPETAPGTPAWVGTSTTVTRGLRLIDEGALDGQGVEQLAARLGVGSRHLRRLFAEHLGTSPLAVARTRRLHFARRLIDETSLPMSRIALGSGFASIRQFNHAIQSRFGRSPSELRRRARARPRSPTAEDLQLRLSYRAPLDWEGLLGFLRPRATAGVEVVTESHYRRTLEIGGETGFLEVQPVAGAPQLLLRLEGSSSAALMPVVERVRRLFDLCADPLQIATDLGRDPDLARRIQARPGIRVPGAWDPFELAVRAVLGQQVTVKGATTLAGRLVRSFGKEIDGNADAGLTHLFPTPEALSQSDLAAIGLPRARADALRTLADAVARGELALASGEGLEEEVERLQRLTGIGAWTAHYIAMRALGEPDAFPASDLGLRRALGKSGEPLTPAALLHRAEAWRPWRAYAAMCLWTSNPPPLQRTREGAKRDRGRQRKRARSTRAPAPKRTPSRSRSSR
jgi:AraC family transcriptional regulator of adaptative response / DNA-3-methyladenine glycosylase II